MTIKPLTPENLYTPCKTDFGFSSTAELEPPEEVIGQDRAITALHFGTRIPAQGYNMYAMGTPGTGKHTAISEMLKQEAKDQELPPDWCYVFNFRQPHRPRALKLPAGYSNRLKSDMDQLIDDLSSAIPAAFETEDYQTRIESFEQELVKRRDEALAGLAEDAEKHRIRLLHTPHGFAFAPFDANGNVIKPEEFEKLPQSEQQQIENNVEALQKNLQRIIRTFPSWQKEVREKVKELDREIARYTVENLINDLKQRHRELPDVVDYLTEVENDVIEHVREFRTQPEQGPMMLLATSRTEALQRYKVNVLVSHEDKDCAPVVYEDLPSHSNLVGRIEYRAQMGTLITDFTLIKAGDLHQANGGFLVLDAVRVLTQPFAWDSLKRALRSREIRIEPLEKAFGLMSTVTLEPEAIPLDVKIVLVGDRLLYYLLSVYDPEFADLFKVSADFEETMDRDADSDMLFARLLAGLARNQEARPLDRGAVARIIEHSARLAEDSEKLSVHMRGLVEVIDEASFCAGEAGRDQITAADVQLAIDARIYRQDRIRARIYEAIKRGTLKIDVEGAKTGQINGLAVLDLGGFSFGQPSRITATVRLGGGKFVDIQRETELGGKIHSKGVLILSSLLSSRYGRDHPLSFVASLVFEQSYGMVDGDSASLAELCALLSVLSGVPIHQQFAVTGSVNQLGEVQAIGGVNQKIEGFFDVCQITSPNNNQAVLIPRSNVPHLMLRHDVVAAVQEGRFAVYAVETVDQAIEILTGRTAGERDEQGLFPADSVNGRVEQTMIEFAKRRKAYVHEDDQEPQHDK